MPNPAIRQAFEQMRSRMQSLHRAERSQMLAALTPQHRVLLAGIAGQLATSVDPDYDAAAQRLNSSLSGAESQAVVRAAQNAARERRRIMESMMPPPGAEGFERMRTRAFPGPASEDAGHVLLRTLIGGGPGLGPMMMRGAPEMRP
jgi:hypothetical protein